MLLNFGRKPVIPDTTAEWMLDSFEWALKNFGSDVFFYETVLVEPSNNFFPGRETSVDGMANLIFDKVKEYAGLSHWVTHLRDEEDVAHLAPQTLNIEHATRGAKAADISSGSSEQLVITYKASQLNDPEVLIGSYAHTLSHYLGLLAREEPPGGRENWPHVTELLAVFLGFGVIMANSAYTAKIISCGSCSGPAVERTNFLSQEDLTYALALFCALKSIQPTNAKRSLKKSLHSCFKMALKDLNGRQDRITQLRSMASIAV